MKPHDWTVHGNTTVHRQSGIYFFSDRKGWVVGVRRVLHTEAHAREFIETFCNTPIGTMMAKNTAPKNAKNTGRKQVDDDEDDDEDEPATAKKTGKVTKGGKVNAPETDDDDEDDDDEDDDEDDAPPKVEKAGKRNDARKPAENTSNKEVAKLLQKALDILKG